MHTIDGTTTTTDYCGNAVYENGELKLLLNDAGYVSFPDKKYHFYIKDHQGNVRVVTDAEGNVEEVNDYYPFGGLMSNATGNEFQRYKYNGKELDRKAGLNLYDYGARFYDPAIGRFMTVDPQSEKIYGYSPYGYCVGNPVKHVDPDGEFPWIATLVGAGIDYVGQVVVNRIEGKDWSESFTDIDMTSIATSAAASATGVGLVSVAGKAITASKIAQVSSKAANALKIASEVATDAAVSAGSQLVKNGEISGSKILRDVVGGQAGGFAGNRVKSDFQNSEKGKLLHRQADHDRRVAGDNPRQSRAERAEQSTQKANDYGGKAATATSTAVSTVTSEAIDEFKKKLEEKL